MSLIGKLLSIPKNACSVVIVSWISILIVGRIYDFHVAYISFIEQIKSEKWLLQHCQDDEFFHNLQYHTDVCREVVENSHIWPSLYGINQSAMKLKLCGFYDCATLLGIIYSGGIPVMVCIFLLYVVTPSFILPILQRTYYEYCEHSIISKCSPMFKQSQIHPLQYQTMDTYDEYPENANKIDPEKQYRKTKYI